MTPAAAAQHAQPASSSHSPAALLPFGGRSHTKSRIVREQRVREPNLIFIELIVLRAIIKSALKRLGLDVKRLLPASNFGLQVARVIVDNGYDLVFDVGANNGQFAAELREFGYAGRIVSFEPLSLAHQRLSKAAAADPAWDVAPRGALGAAAGSTIIHISGLPASSSLLTMNATHEMAAPGSAAVGSEHVDISTLDDVAPAYLDSARKVFLKIDTQGFELEILKGAAETLSLVDGMLLELSLVELYEGQPLWTDVIDWLKERGFDLVGLNQGFMDPVSFRTLQVDGIFQRRATV